MKESVLDIKLIQRPRTTNYNREENLNRVETSYKRESLLIINTLCLCVSFGNQLLLNVLNRAIKEVLDGVYPMTTYIFFFFFSSSFRGRSSELLGLILMKNTHFLTYSMSPSR